MRFHTHSKGSVTIHWHLSSRVLLVSNKMTRVPIGCDSPVPARHHVLLVRVSCLSADCATAFQCWIVGCCCGAWVIIWNSAMLKSTSSLLVNRTYRITPTTTTCESCLPSVVLSNEKVFSFYSTNREESEDSSNCPIGMNRLLWIVCFCLLQLLSSTELYLRSYNVTVWTKQENKNFFETSNSHCTNSLQKLFYTCFRQQNYSFYLILSW